MLLAGCLEEIFSARLFMKVLCNGLHASIKWKEVVDLGDMIQNFEIYRLRFRLLRFMYISFQYVM